MDEKVVSQPIAKEIRALEEALLAPAVRGSSEAPDDLLADEFVEFGSSGRAYDKQQVLASMPQQPAERFSVEDFRVQVLAPGVVLAMYRAIRHDYPPRYTLRCSISGQSGRIDGRWCFTRARLPTPFRMWIRGRETPAVI
jgi:hypothetical protein